MNSSLKKRHRAILEELLLMLVTISLAICTNVHADDQSIFSVDQMSKLIEKHDIRTVDALLSYLPAPLRSHFALMRESTSSQGASPEAPRAILFGEDGKLLLAFNGNPKQEGYLKVEAIQFREPGRFEFREISFSPDGSSQASVSDPNPKRCLSCHGTNPRPIWPGYHHWRGAYGSNDDELVRGSLEHQEFEGFLAHADKEDRYRHLIFPERKDNPLGIYHEVGVPRVGFQYDTNEKNRKLRYMPNSRLGMLVSRLDAKVAATGKIFHRNFQKYGALFVFDSVLYCSERALSPALKNALAALRAELKKDYVSITKDDRDVIDSLKLSYVLPADYSRDEGVATANYFDGAHSEHEYVNWQVAQALVRDDPRLADLFSTMGATMARRYQNDDFLTASEAKQIDALGVALSGVAQKSDHIDEKTFDKARAEACEILAERVKASVDRGFDQPVQQILEATKPTHR